MTNINFKHNFINNSKFEYDIQNIKINKFKKYFYVIKIYFKNNA